MAYTGRVNIVQRKEVLHCGYGVKMADRSVKFISVCNKTWNVDDKVYVADAVVVTCERCQKLLERANETGYMCLPRRAEIV